MGSRNNIIPVLVILLSLKMSVLFSQDIHFSQFYTSPLLLNPAAAGASNSDFRFAANYRNQWRSVMTPFKTLALAFDSKFYTNKRKVGSYFGYGFTLFNDKTGLSKLTTNQLSIDLSYHLYLNRYSSLSAGVKTGFIQKSINTSNLKWDAQFDGRTYDASAPTGENGVYQSFMKFDLSAGLMYQYTDKDNTKHFELGASVFHLTKPNISFYSANQTLGYKYLAHALYQFPINENTYLIPTALFALQGKQSEITAGGNIKYLLGSHTKDKVLLSTVSQISSAIMFGAFYRGKDAVIFTTALEYNRSMTFGFSYDVNVSKFRNASNWRGAYEFSFILVQQKRSKLRTKY